MIPPRLLREWLRGMTGTGSAPEALQKKREMGRSLWHTDTEESAWSNITIIYALAYPEGGGGG